MKVPIEISVAYSLMRKRAEENAKFDLVAWIRNKIKTKGTMAHKTTEENKFEFLIRLAGHTESKIARTIEDDMDEEQIRRECLDILGTWQGDCPVGVDVYRNGEYFTSEDVED